MIDMRLLVVDLLAERKAFGKEGVREIISHFDDPEVFLWSPHTNERTEYGFGTVVEGPVDCDFIAITGSRRNVSSWEVWICLLYTSPSPRDMRRSRMPSSA